MKESNYEDMTLSYVPALKKILYNRSTHNSFSNVCDKLSKKYEFINSYEIV